MNELIRKYFENSISEKERKELYSLLKEDAELKKEFIDAKNIYGLASLLPRKEDIGEGLESLSLFKKKHSRNKKNVLLFLAYAASICFAIVLTKLFYDHRTSQDTFASQYEEIFSPYGQHTIVTLGDGSKVWLNSNTTLKAYPFQKGKERSVELDGEAYFEVVHDESSIFKVYTKDADVSVFGTKFNVFAYGEGNAFSASLLDGSVQVSGKSDDVQSVTLKPNEKVELIEGRLVKSKIENSSALSWKNGIYTFENMTLGEIAKKLEVYYGAKLEISDESLAEVRFSGKFRQGDRIENILRALQAIKPFAFREMENGKIEITRK